MSKEIRKLDVNVDEFYDFWGEVKRGEVWNSDLEVLSFKNKQIRSFITKARKLSQQLEKLNGEAYEWCEKRLEAAAKEEYL